MSLVSYQVLDGVAVLTIQNPPVNAIGPEVQQELAVLFGTAMSDASVNAVVLIGGGQTFIAGADIRNLQTLAREGRSLSVLPGLLMDIESAVKPVIAALHGSAFGGGLETAMAAHYRVAAPGTKLGQPEVKLGLIPGAGGTQRLPRLAGVEKALEMCAYGEPVTAEEALGLGLIDQVVQGDLLSAALNFAGSVAGQSVTRTRDRAVTLGTRDQTLAIFAAAREKARHTRRNLNAPLAAIDAVEAATQLSFEQGCVRERELFNAQLASNEARALIHVFFAERAVARIPGLKRDQPGLPVTNAAVIGAGTMGRGIAMCFANAGIPVRLKETNPELLDAAMAWIRSLYEGSVAKGRISAAEMSRRLGSIQPQLDYAGFASADLIIEAVFERLELKQHVFSEVGALARPDAILATNTSYLNVDQIAAAAPHPDHLIGLHFFSPANVMRLLEVVPGAATSKEVLATAIGLGKKLGKLGVVAGNCPGFIGNRMLRAYRREAQLLLEEGASPRAVDEALETFGMAMGPFAVQDLAGIDIAMSSRDVFIGVDPAGMRQPRVIERLFELGRYGQKTGAGWYRYDEKRKPQADPAVDAIIESVAKQAGTKRRKVAAVEIVDRVVLAWILEGVRILEEGFALRASDIDMVLINGYGFPSYRGGPMQYADSLGLEAVVARARAFQQLDAVAWRIPALLDTLATGRQSFAEWDLQREQGTISAGTGTRA